VRTRPGWLIDERGSYRDNPAMTRLNPVVAALPAEGWRFVTQDKIVKPVVGFLVHADGSVVAVGVDLDDANTTVRPVDEMYGYNGLLPPPGK
jgi:hypothetical protein